MDLHNGIMTIQSLYQAYNRFLSLKTDRISSLPIVILMPHSSCNCRCVMCDIWKGNSNLKQLSETDIRGLLSALKKYQTQRVVMSGGEALLNPQFFRFCEILKTRNIKISLLSSGLTIKKNASELVRWVDDIIVSLDGDEFLHDRIRNIPGAFNKLKEGIESVRSINPHFQISGRSVIQHLNFRNWPGIINAAKRINLNSISFLPADISSTAFNRETAWAEGRQREIVLAESELKELKEILDDIIVEFAEDFKHHFISESPEKLQKIFYYYAACHGFNEFPYKKCNAPWVSTVIEADGTVRPCFFHNAYGNIKTDSLDSIINSRSAIEFRKNLDMDKNETCLKCVCYLNLKPTVKV
ncbi:MAG TPA: radical SAM protein [Puia sp.]|nr:radical SAM protein [Puia sp.]